jgi:hypothetical protein
LWKETVSVATQTPYYCNRALALLFSFATSLDVFSIRREKTAVFWILYEFIGLPAFTLFN